MRPRWAGILLLIGGLAATACKDVRSLMTLRNGLAKAFETPELGVSLVNGGTLVITLQNSPVDGQAGDQEQDTCRQVAEYVRDHFDGYASLQTIQVSFATRSGAAGFSMTRSRTPCSFTHEELGEPRTEPPAAPGDSTAPAT